MMLKALSRRSFLQYTAAGSAVALPIAAEAAGADVLPISDEQALEACIGQLKNILQRMHPSTYEVSHHLNQGQDGSFCFTMQGYVRYLDFEGDGFYFVSMMDGYLLPFWVEERLRKRQDGRIIDRFYLGYQFEEAARGEPAYFCEASRICGSKLVRKAEMPDGMTLADIPFSIRNY